LPPRLRCPDGSFLDPLDPKRCIPFEVLTGTMVTIFQGPDCWPKKFTIEAPFSPAMTAVLVEATRRETKGLKPAALMRKLGPALLKRVKRARSVPLRKSGPARRKRSAMRHR
jgi:hypothetical protein